MFQTIKDVIYVFFKKILFNYFMASWLFDVHIHVLIMMSVWFHSRFSLTEIARDLLEHWVFCWVFAHCWEYFRILSIILESRRKVIIIVKSLNLDLWIFLEVSEVVSGFFDVHHSNLWRELQLQGQLERLTESNKELRRKHSQISHQMRALVEERADLQASLQEQSRNVTALNKRLGLAQRDNQDLVQSQVLDSTHAFHPISSYPNEISISRHLLWQNCFSLLISDLEKRKEMLK